MCIKIKTTCKISNQLKRKCKINKRLSKYILEELKNEEFIKSDYDTIEKIYKYVEIEDDINFLPESFFSSFGLGEFNF
jgi:hypothetical protein